MSRGGARYTNDGVLKTGRKKELPPDVKNFSIFLSEQDIAKFRALHGKNSQKYARLAIVNFDAVLARLIACQKALLDMDKHGEIKGEVFDIYGSIVIDNPLPDSIEDIEFYEKCKE